MSDSAPPYHDPDDRPWGWMDGDVFRLLPRQPMVLAGLGPPPFDVKLLSGEVRHIIMAPAAAEASE